MSLQELQSQRANFIAAYAQHKITKQQLDAALAYNQKQIDALKASSQQQAPVTPAQTATVPSQPVSAMPAEFPAQQFTDQSGNTNAPEETMSLQEVQSQRANFIAAYAQHEITKQELDAALAYNQEQIDALEGSSQQQATVTPAQTATVPSQPKMLLRLQDAPEELPERLQVIPTAMGPIPVKTFEAGAKDPTMQNIVIPAMEVAGIAALSAIPGAAPVVIGGAVAGVGLDIGIKSVSKSIETGEAQLVLPGSVREVTDTALLSAGLSAVGGGAVGAVAKVAPSIAGQTASFAARTGTHAAINAGLGGGVSGVASGGDPKAILEGAAFGAGLGIAGQIAGPVFNKTVASKPVQALLNNKTVQSIGKSASNIKENVIGTKFTEITGAKETFLQQTKGKETSILRVTQPETKTVRLRGDEARLYKETNLETMKNPIIELSGTQKIQIVQQDAVGVLESITTFPKAPTRTTASTTKLDMVGDINKEFGGVIENVKYKGGELPLRDPTVITSTRSAKPILEALKGKTRTFEKVSPVSETKISTTKGRVYPERPIIDLGTDKPVTVLEQRGIVPEGKLLPIASSAARRFDRVKIYDKPTNTQDILSRATGKPKAVTETPQLFEKVTGKVAEKPVKPSDTPPLVNNEQIKILKEQDKIQNIWDKVITDKTAFAKREAGDLSGAMKAGSNDFFRSNAKNTVGKTNAKTQTVQTVKSTTKEQSVLPRAIVGEAKPSVASRGSAWTTVGTISIWNRQRQTQPEIIEETPVSYPKDSPLQSPKTIPEESTTQQGKQDDGLTPINVIPVPPRTDDWSIPVVPDPVKPEPPSVIPIPIPIFIPSETPDTTPDTTPDITPVIIPDITPVTIPDIKQIPDITPVIIPDITPVTIPDIKQIPDIILDITPVTIPDITPGKKHIFTPRTFTLNKRTMPPPIIPFTRGGGESAARGFKNFWGAAGLRKQAIPTPKELLEQAGLGKTRFKAKSLVATGNKFFAKPTKSKGKSRRKR